MGRKYVQNGHDHLLKIISIKSSIRQMRDLGHERYKIGKRSLGFPLKEQDQLHKCQQFVKLNSGGSSVGQINYSIPISN